MTAPSTPGVKGSPTNLLYDKMDVRLTVGSEGLEQGEKDDACWDRDEGDEEGGKSRVGEGTTRTSVRGSPSSEPCGSANVVNAGGGDAAASNVTGSR